MISRTGNAVRLFSAGLLMALLAACSMTPVNAPVASLDSTPQTDAVPLARPVTTDRPGYYRVRRGDTLYSVAWQHGLNFRQLAEMNAIRPPYTIYAGQSLRIAPLAGAPSAPTPASRSGQTAARRSKPAAPPPTGTGLAPGPVVVAAPAAAGTPAAEPATAPEPVAKSEPALPAVVTHWVWPVKGPLLRGYTPDATGKKGIDIGGKIGEPVVSAADGKVVYSGSGLVGYGRLIIIKHNDSLLSAYGHNSELLVTEGDYVKAGQVIAKMGSSGTSSPRLYFEIRQDGKPVNPLRYLPRG
jgi:lipoprotein NlpD